MTRSRVLELLDRAIRAHHPDPDGDIALNDQLSDYGAGAKEALESLRVTFLGLLPK